MAITTDKLVHYLRNSVDIRLDDEDVRDELYLKMSDEDVLLYIEMAHSRAFGDYDIGDEEIQYALMLLAKKELYLALAIRHARYVDMGADDNNYLKKSQWFDHYMKLAAQADKDYLDYLDNEGVGGLNGVYSANAYLNTRYYTDYNFEKANLPTIRLKTVEVTEDMIEVAWKYSADRYRDVEIWVSDLPIVDVFELDSTQISEIATRVARVTHPHLNHCRIRGCAPGATYHIAAIVTDWTGRSVFHEIEVTTLTSVEDDDEEIGEIVDEHTVESTL